MSPPPTGPPRRRSTTALPRPCGKNGWRRPSAAVAIGLGVSAGADREGPCGDGCSATPHYGTEIVGVKGTISSGDTATPVTSTTLQGRGGSGLWRVNGLGACMARQHAHHGAQEELDPDGIRSRDHRRQRGTRRCGSYFPLRVAGKGVTVDGVGPSGRAPDGISVYSAIGPSAGNRRMSQRGRRWSVRRSVHSG